MLIIDSQVHAYAANTPDRPWAGTLAGPPSVTGDDMVRAMDSAGVDAAVLVSPWSLYRTDTSYASDVHDAFPGRFALVAPVDPSLPGAKDAVAQWATTPGAVGIRLMVGFTDNFDADHPDVRDVVHAATAHGLPVCVFAWRKLSVMDELAHIYSDTQFVLDHLGITQPMRPPVPEQPWAELPQVLTLARYPNVAVKVSGACTLSHQPFPFDDLWEPLGRLFDAFGVERCMWGTDWTRTFELVGFDEAVAAFRDHAPISAPERTQLMGGTLQEIFRWSPSG